MLDELRRDIERRINDLLSEADKLRHALGALGSDGRAASSEPRGESPAPRSRRATTATRTPKRASSTAATPAASQPAPTSRARARGTKDAVLAALASGDAMTASDVANATGLGRASVSTTLSKLAKTGEVTKAPRGYQLAGQSTPEPTTAARRASKVKPAGSTGEP